MAGIVIGGAVRYAVHQVLAGRPVVNIVDMHLDIVASFQQRASEIETLAGDLLNNWSDHVLALQCDKISATEITWVDLNSENGSVGSRSSTDANTWPMVGQQPSSVPFPGMVACRVIKHTSGGRKERKGRMYLAGFDEGKTGEDANRLLPAVITDVNREMGEFLDGMSDDILGTTSEHYPVVLHTPKEGDPSATRITGYSCDPLLGTQRRRTRG